MPGHTSNVKKFTFILASKPCLSPFWMHGYTWDLEIFQSQALDARIEIRKPYRHLADGSRTDEFQSYGATVGLEISNSVLGHHVTLFNGKHEEALQTPIGAEKIFLTSKFSIPRWHCRIGKCQYGRNPYSLFDQKKVMRASLVLTGSNPAVPPYDRGAFFSMWRVTFLHF